MKNLSSKIRDFDIITYIKTLVKNANTPFLTAFLSTFLALNLIFIYHSAHFMFGDHDWRYLKQGIALTDGLFEGRFSQFIFINLLTQGEILPIINNILGFLGFSLGIALLGKYWQLPNKKVIYTLFALFTAITPYILSFMYFAFLIPPVLSWNAVIILALIISDKEKTFNIKYTISASILITLALGGYPPVINLIGVAFTTHILLGLLDNHKTVKSIIKDNTHTIINIILGIILYKLCIIYLTKTGAINSSYYNLQTTPFNEWPQKFSLVLKDIFTQFSVSLPFITSFYKAILSLISLTAIYTIITDKTSKKQRLITITLYFIIFLSATATLFLSTSIKETEFSPRIDFFGFLYVMAASVTIILKSKQNILKNLCLVLMISSITLSTNTLFEAQKVWKLGYDTELKLYRRVIKRVQKDELFTYYNRYIIVQGGAPSFRERYYYTPYTHASDDLLSISYIPGLAPGVVLNYDTPHEYADNTSYAYTFIPDYEFKNKLKNAKPWPALESTAVGNYWIMLALTPSGLESLRQNYLP